MYFKISRVPAHRRPCRWMADWPFIDGADFDIGEKISIPVPGPLEFVLEPLNPNVEEHGPEMPAIFDLAVPLFRDDVVAAMTAGGVDNIDYYDAVVKEPDGSRTYTHYRAANIVGLVANAELVRATGTAPLIFRLEHRSTGSIWVHDRLRQHLLACGFDELVFQIPGEAII